jgi:hypothetical protein
MRGRWAGALVALGLTVACSREEARQSTSVRVLPGSGPGASLPAAPAEVDAAPRVSATIELPRIEPDGPDYYYQVTEVVEAAAPPVDPNLAVLQAARASAGGCFAGLSGGPEVRSAVIRVTVVPGGTVSRTEVFPADPDVVDCLRRVGDGLHFSALDEKKISPGGGVRSFSINVSVARPH